MGNLSKTYTWSESSPFHASEFNQDLFNFYGSNSGGSRSMFRGMDSANFSSISTVTWPASQINVNDTNVYWSPSNIVANITADTVTGVEKIMETIAAKTFSISPSVGTWALVNTTATTLQGIVRDLASQVSALYDAGQGYYSRLMPHLEFVSGSTLNIEQNVSSSLTTEILFPDNTIRIASGGTASIRYFQASSCGVFNFGSACMVAGMLSAETIDTSAFISIYAVGVCAAAGTRTDHFTLIGTKNPPIHSNTALNTGIAQLNSQFGTANWMYMGTVRRDDSSILSFRHQGNEMWLREPFTLTSASQGTSAFTYTITQAMSGNNIPEHFGFLRTELMQDVVTGTLGAGRHISTSDFPNSTNLHIWLLDGTADFTGTDIVDTAPVAEGSGTDLTSAANHISQSAHCQFSATTASTSLNDELITSATQLQQSDSFSVGGWFFQTSPQWDDTNFKYMVTRRGDGAGLGAGWELSKVSTRSFRVQLEVGVVTHLHTWSANSTVIPAGWHHMAATIAMHCQSIIYFDGTAVSTLIDTATGYSANSLSLFCLGADTDNMGNFQWDGRMQDTFLHQGTVLTALQVQTIYSAAFGAQTAQQFAIGRRIDGNPVYNARTTGRSEVKSQHLWPNRAGAAYEFRSTVSQCSVEVNVLGWMDGKL